jgi:glycosyltransferase involved in cell wall biosynthesis
VVENRPMKSSPMQVSGKAVWTVAHIGRLRDLDSMELLISAVLSMAKEHRPRLLVAGDGHACREIREALGDAAENHEIDVEMRGAFDQDSISDLLCETNVMFAMYNPNRGNINDGAIPVKMFDAAARGIPSIVNSGCLMGEVCESENLGMQVKWNDVQGLADGLQRLRNSRVELLITGERERRKYLEALEGLLPSTGG